jgi:hypothetical protein
VIWRGLHHPRQMTQRVLRIGEGSLPSPPIRIGLNLFRDDRARYGSSSRGDSRIGLILSASERVRYRVRPLRQYVPGQLSLPLEDGLRSPGTITVFARPLNWRAGRTWHNVLCLSSALQSSGLRPFSTELRKPCRAGLCGREHVGRVRERARMVEKHRYPSCGRGPVVTQSGLVESPLWACVTPRFVVCRTNTERAELRGSGG